MKLDSNVDSLGCLMNLESGFAFKSSDWVEAGTPVIKIRNVQDGYVDLSGCSFVSQQTAVKASEWFGQVGNTLIALTGAGVGEIGRIHENQTGLINQRVGWVRAKDSGDEDYIYYLLRYFKQKIIDLATGSAQPNVSPRDILRISCQVPEKSQRVVVGSFLTVIDKKIELNGLLVKTLEDIAQAIFKSWFIDFDPVKAKMAGDKPVGMDDVTAALFPDSMEDSELGLIPRNWTSARLDDELLLLESGKRPRGGAAGESGVPSIGAESIRGLGAFDFSNTKFIPIDFYDSMPTGRVNKFDVLVYKDGAGAGSYVSMFGCGFPFEKFAINEHVFLLRAKSVSQYFLYFWMAQNKIKNLMIELAQKSAQPGLNQKDMRTIGFLRPETSVVEKFSEIVEPIIMEVMKLANQSRQLSTIRDTLLPRLISGELQIPEEVLAT